MSDELTFRDVSYPNFFEGFSFELPSGSSTLIVTSREAESALLSRLITGLSLPSHGCVLVDEQEITTFTPEQLYDLRQQIGIVPSHGGLISNLKVWENITLPLMYHAGEVTPEDEQTAQTYLATLGYSGNVMVLPAHLSLHEKRIIALVRAFLTRPRMIVYCNCFDGLPSTQHSLFSRMATEFHTTRDDRISLYLASSADMAVELCVDRVIHVHETTDAASRNI